MLNQLLNRIRQGRPWTVEALAKELETTPEMIRMMLDDLAKRGYLRRADQACSHTCSTCPMANVCLHDQEQRVWTWVSPSSQS